MGDQISVLRQMANLGPAVHSNGLRVISVTSGKGGVGKTNFSVNLAIALASYGYRVTILDGDLGLANVNVAFGLNAPYSIAHLLSGEKPIEDILIKGPKDIFILPGGSGIQELAELNRRELEFVVMNFGKLEKFTDILIIDTGAGLGQTVTNFLSASDDIILLTTQEPTALTDAYGLLKTLRFSRKIPVNVVVNRVKGEDEAKETYQRLEIATQKFLNRPLNMLGWVYEDAAVGKSVMRQEPLGIAFPESSAFKCIEWIAGSMAGIYQAAPRKKMGIKGFLTALLQG